MAKSNPWAKRMQIQFLLQDQVLTMNARACLFQFGVLKRGTSDGNPIVWMNVLRTGRTLFGPPARTFVPAITGDMLAAALERELGYLRDEIIDKPDSIWKDVLEYRTYAVLTVCRILYSAEKGTIVSKPVAARWALRTLPKGWHRVIRQALEGDVKMDLSSVRHFLRYAGSVITLGQSNEQRS